MASRCHTSEELELWARNLLETIDRELAGVGNILRLRRKVEAELAFLRKFRAENEPSTELKCTNLTQLGAVIDYLKDAGDAVETVKVFKTPANSGLNLSVLVDVVTAKGIEWRKIIARNPSGLLREYRGQAEFKRRRTLFAQARHYLKVAHYHPIDYRTPKIYFHFLCGVDRKMAERLESRGIRVEGRRLENDSAEVESDDETKNTDSDTDGASISDYEATDDIGVGSLGSFANLDITACITLISNVSHGRCHFRFVDSILTQQAESERHNPVFPSLHDFLKDKDLIMCRTAHRELMKIVGTIGGENERLRLDELMSRVRVVDDVMTERTRRLVDHGKVKERSRLIFGTGDAWKAVTVTANSGFVRAARGQGVEFSVFLHEARALTEMKEATALPL